MVSDFKKIISLFSKEEKSKGYKLLFLVSLMALVDVFSIASTFPFISLPFSSIEICPDIVSLLFLKYIILQG